MFLDDVTVPASISPARWHPSIMRPSMAPVITGWSAKADSSLALLDRGGSDHTALPSARFSTSNVSFSGRMLMAFGAQPTLGRCGTKSPVPRVCRSGRTRIVRWIRAPPSDPPPCEIVGCGWMFVGSMEPSTLKEPRSVRRWKRG